MIRTLNHFIQERMPSTRSAPTRAPRPEQASAAKESVKVASSAGYRKAAS